MKRNRLSEVLGWVLCAGILLTVPAFASGGDEDMLPGGMFPREDDAVSAAAGETEMISPQAISAECAVLTDEHGTVLFEKNADLRVPMASTTKIMTALAALEACSDTLDKPVRVPKEAIGVEGSSVYLYEGEQLTMRELLYAMLMESANDAAAAVAVTVSGSTQAFAGLMNEKAAALGLENTHFVNPHGLHDDAHYTTARELAVLTAEALKNPVFREIVGTYKKEIPLRETEGMRLLVNHNRLLKTCEGCIGVKTGYTVSAGRCLVSACTRQDSTLICVTLSAPDDWNDHCLLYDWGFSKYGTVTLAEAGSQYAVLPVVGGVTDADDGVATVTVNNKDSLTAVILRGNAEITERMELPRFLYAPVTEGKVVGRVLYYNNGKCIGEVPLVTCGSVALYVKPTLWQRIAAFFRRDKKK